MKLFFRKEILLIFILMATFPCQGKTRRELFKITHSENKWLANKAREILQETYGIPESFIHMQQKAHPCQRSEISRESLLHICVTKEGHKILRAKARILKQSFDIFRRVSETNTKRPSN